MRCCALPTTSNADRRPHDTVDRQALALCERSLFRAALAPLAESLGFFGDLALDACLDPLVRTREKTP